MYCEHVLLPDLSCLVQSVVSETLFYSDIPFCPPITGALVCGSALLCLQASGYSSPNMQNGSPSGVRREDLLKQMLICEASVQETPLACALWWEMPVWQIHGQFLARSLGGNHLLTPEKEGKYHHLWSPVLLRLRRTKSEVQFCHKSWTPKSWSVKLQSFGECLFGN